MSFKLSRRQFAAATIAAGAAAAAPALPAFAIGPFGKGLRTVKQVFGHSAGSLEQARRDLGINRPASLAQMATRFVDDLVFDQPLNTSDGVALGGRHTLRIQRDGTFTYSGHFRATGLPSYTASVVTTLAYPIRNPEGQPASAVAAFVARGRVHGSIDPGDAVYSWSQTGNVPILASEWGNVRIGKFQRDLQYKADFLGPAGDVAGFIGKIAAAGLVFGSAGAGVMLLGEAANVVDIRGLSVPNIVGVIAAGGAYYVLGPGMLVPAFVAGAGVTKAVLKQEPLSPADVVLAKKVFGDTIPYDRVRKTNLLGIGNRPFAMISPIDKTILINLGDGFYNSDTYRGNGRSEAVPGAPGQLLIHELTHAWQIEHSSWQPEFYCRAIPDAIAKNYSYGPAGVAWDDLGNEQQAAIVEEWYAGYAGKKYGESIARPGMNAVWKSHDNAQTHCPQMATESVLCEDKKVNPYYHYIVENIRARRR